MSVLAGKVASIMGTVQATNPITGEVRILKVGDEIMLGDIITTPVDGSVTISLDNGDLLTLGRDTKMALTEDVVGSPGMTDPVTEGAVDVAALQQAVLEGNFDALEETAAGGGDATGGSANEGGTLNSVDRIGAEGDVTSGFDTSTVTTSSTFTQEQVATTEVDLTLTAEQQQITEDDTLVAYTVTLDKPAISEMQVTLDNGAIITILAGETTGSVDFNVIADPDVYIEADTQVVAEVASTAGGGFDVVNVTNDASTTIVDTIDTTTVSLSSTESTSEEDGSIVYTATLSNVANNDVTVTLDNGEIIIIGAGSLSGNSNAVAVNQDDIYLETDSISAAITGVSEANAGTEGALENLTFDATPATTVIDDDSDAVTVSLSATESTSEDEGSIIYTATLSDVANNDVTVTLDNGESITIIAGNLSGDSAPIEVNRDDVYLEDDSISAAITGVNEANAGTDGAFENLTFDATPATTVIIDDSDAVTVSLSATESTSEDGGSIIYTATLSDVANNDVTVTLDNGESILISAGSLSGNSNAVAVNRDSDIAVVASGDIYIEDDSISAAITGVSEANAGTEGAFENLTFDSTPATTIIIDDQDAVSVNLRVTNVETNQDNAIENVTFTAELSHPGLTDVTLTTEHGEIVILEGQTTGSIQVPFNSGSGLSASVSNVVGGNFESVDLSGATAIFGSVVEAVDVPGMQNYNAGTSSISGTLSGSNFSTTSSSSYGTFNVEPTTGLWTYELDNDLPATNQLKVGDVISEEFEVIVDGEIQKVEVKIVGKNDTPEALDATYTEYSTDTISGINLANKTKDVEDDFELIITKVKITDLPEFGDLYDDDGNVLAVGDEVLDTADIRYTVDSSIDLTPSFNAQDDFKDDNGNLIANNTVSSVTLTNGLVISGGTFNGAVPVKFGESSLAVSGDTLNEANLYYDSANNETGLGVGSDKELNSSAKEYISIKFLEHIDVVTNADLYFGSVYGNYQDSNRADAQINVIALKGGKVVSEFSFNDTHNGSGEFVAPIVVDGGYDELRVFTLAEVNSNITFQGVEVVNMTVADSFGYDAVDSNGASEGAIVDLNISTFEENFKHFIEYDDAGRLPEAPEIPATMMGEKIVINNFDGQEDDILNLSQIMDGKVTENNIDQYLKLAFIDENDDGVNDTALFIVDSNGDKAGGDITELYLQNTIGGVDGKDVWTIYAGINEDTNMPVIGDFDLDN